jgi:hypothetical protein
VAGRSRCNGSPTDVSGRDLISNAEGARLAVAADDQWPDGHLDARPRRGRFHHEGPSPALGGLRPGIASPSLCRMPNPRI